MFNKRRAKEIIQMRSHIHSNAVPSTQTIGEYQKSIFAFFSKKKFSTIHHNLSKILIDLFGGDPYLSVRGEGPSPTALQTLENRGYAEEALAHIERKEKDFLHYERKQHSDKKGILPVDPKLIDILIGSKRYDQIIKISQYIFEKKESISREENKGETISDLFDIAVGENRMNSQWVYENIEKAVTVFIKEGKIDNDALIDLITHCSKSTSLWSKAKKLPWKRWFAVLGLIGALSTYYEFKKTDDGTFSSDYFIENKDQKQGFVDYQDMINGTRVYRDSMEAIYHTRVYRDGMKVIRGTNNDYETLNRLQYNISKHHFEMEDNLNKKGYFDTIMQRNIASNGLPLSLEQMRQNWSDNTELLYSLMEFDKEKGYKFVQPGGDIERISEEVLKENREEIQLANLKLLDQIIDYIYKQHGSEAMRDKSRGLVNNIISHPSRVSVNQDISDNNISIYLNNRLHGDKLLLVALHELLHSFNRKSISAIVTEGKTDRMAISYFYMFTGVDSFQGFHELSKEGTEDYSNLSLASYILENLFNDQVKEFSITNKEAEGVEVNRNIKEVDSHRKKICFEYLQKNHKNDVDPRYLLYFLNKSQRDSMLIKLKQTEQIYEEAALDGSLLIKETGFLKNTVLSPLMTRELIGFLEDDRFKILYEYADICERNCTEEALGQYFDDIVLPHLFGGPITLNPTVPHSNYIDHQLLKEMAAIDALDIRDMAKSNTNFSKILEFLTKYFYLYPALIFGIFIIIRIRRLGYLRENKDNKTYSLFKTRLDRYKRSKIYGIGLITIAMAGALQYQAYKSNNQKQFLKLKYEQLLIQLDKSFRETVIPSGLSGSLEDEAVKKLKMEVQQMQQIKKTRNKVDADLQKITKEEKEKRFLLHTLSGVIFILGLGLAWSTNAKFKSKKYLQQNLQPIFTAEGLAYTREGIHRLFNNAGNKEGSGIIERLGLIIFNNTMSSASKRDKWAKSNYNYQITRFKNNVKLHKKSFIDRLMNLYQNQRTKDALKPNNERMKEDELFEISSSDYFASPHSYRLSKHRKNTDPSGTKFIAKKEINITEKNKKPKNYILFVTILEPSIHDTRDKPFENLTKCLSYCISHSKTSKDTFQIKIMFNENENNPNKEVAHIFVKNGNSDRPIRDIFEKLYDICFEYPIFLEGRTDYDTQSLRPFLGSEQGLNGRQFGNNVELQKIIES